MFIKIAGQQVNKKCKEAPLGNGNTVSCIAACERDACVAGSTHGFEKMKEGVWV